MVIRELFAKLGLKVDPSGFNKADFMIGALKGGLLSLGAAVTGGAVYKGLKGLADMAYQAGYQSEIAARRIGIGAEALQELREAGDDVGVSSAAVDAGLRFLGRNAYEAAHGSKELAGTFSRLGVTLKDGDGKLRSADDLLMDLADAFEKMPEAERPAAAMRLLGRSGTELIPLLIKGKAAIGEMRGEAVAMGLVMDKGARESARNYHEALDELEDSVRGLKLSIGGALLPEFARMYRAAGAWLRQNRELIRSRVVDWALQFARVLEAVVSTVSEIVTWLTRLLGMIWRTIEASTELKSIFLLLGLWIAAAFVPGILAIGLILTAIEELWGWITGKRKTMLQEWFGSFEDLKKNNPIAQAINEWITQLDRVEQKLRFIRNLFTGKANVTEHDAFARKLAEAVKVSSPLENANDPRLRDPRWKALVEAEDWDTIRKEYGPGSGFKAPTTPLMRTPAPSAGVQIGTIILNGAATDQPEDFARKFIREWEIQVGIAGPAVMGGG